MFSKSVGINLNKNKAEVCKRLTQGP